MIEHPRFSPSSQLFCSNINILNIVIEFLNQLWFRKRLSPSPLQLAPESPCLRS